MASRVIDLAAGAVQRNGIYSSTVKHNVYEYHVAFSADRRVTRTYQHALLGWCHMCPAAQLVVFLSHAVDGIWGHAPRGVAYPSECQHPMGLAFKMRFIQATPPEVLGTRVEHLC